MFSCLCLHRAGSAVRREHWEETMHVFDYEGRPFTRRGGVRPSISRSRHPGTARRFRNAPVFAQNAYITNNTSANVSVIDTATAAVIATVPVGSRPFGVAVSP